MYNNAQSGLLENQIRESKEVYFQQSSLVFAEGTVVGPHIFSAQTTMAFQRY